jgi:hypothetical protein
MIGLKQLGGINKKYAMIAGAAVLLIGCLGFFRMPAPKLANLSRPKLALLAADESPATAKRPAPRAGLPAGAVGPAAGVAAPTTPEGRRQAAQQRRAELMARRQNSRTIQGTGIPPGEAGAGAPVNPLTRIGPSIPPASGAVPPAPRAAGVGARSPAAPAAAPPQAGEPEAEGAEEEGADAAIQ